MNIAVFFKAFEPGHEYRDPGQIVLGLRDIGANGELYTIGKESLKNSRVSFPVHALSKDRVTDFRYWADTPHNTVIVYTRLDHSNLWIIEILKKAGKKVIVKADSDGRKLFPLYPRDLMNYAHSNIAEKSKALCTRIKRRLKGSIRAGRLAEHVSCADAIILESAQARANLSYILTYWGRPELISKIHCIPNPVPNSFTTSSIPTKSNLIVAAGNWDIKVADSYVKNTSVMMKALCRFLTSRADFDAVIMGAGAEIVSELAIISGSPQNLKILGSISNEEVRNYVAKAKIVFQPSLFETFGIAVAEGLCMGCSFVGSPIESFTYLSQGGFSGTLAPDFSESAYYSALIADSINWDNNLYSPEIISSYWRSLLKRDVVAQRFMQLAIDLK